MVPGSPVRTSCLDHKLPKRKDSVPIAHLVQYEINGLNTPAEASGLRSRGRAMVRVRERQAVT